MNQSIDQLKTTDFEYFPLVIFCTSVQINAVYARQLRHWGLNGNPHITKQMILSRTCRVFLQYVR